MKKRDYRQMDRQLRLLTKKARLKKMEPDRREIKTQSSEKCKRIVETLLSAG